MNHDDGVINTTVVTYKYWVKLSGSETEFSKPDTIPHQHTVILSVNLFRWITPESFPQTVNVGINLGCSSPLIPTMMDSEMFHLPNLPAKIALVSQILTKAVTRQSLAVGPFRGCLGFNELPQSKSCFWECGLHPMINFTGSIKTH